MLTYVRYTCIDCVVDEFVFMYAKWLSHSLGIKGVRCISYYTNIGISRISSRVISFKEQGSVEEIVFNNS